MGCTNRRKGLLGQAAALGVDVEHLALVARVHRDADKRNDHIDGDDGADDERQLPVDDKRDDKGSYEGGDALDDDAELLGDSVADEIAVGGDLAGDGGRRFIEEGNLLAQDLPNKVNAKLLDGADTRDRDEDLVYLSTKD